MMDEQKIKTPIEMMGDLLAAMTARAVEAERQRDEALKSSDEWYQLYLSKDAQFKDMEASFNQEAEAHERTRKRLREYIAKMEEESTHE